MRANDWRNIMLVDVPPLSAAEERKLIAAAQRGDAKARDRVVLSHQLTVLKVASKYANRSVMADIEDLYTEGFFGLMHALKKFDLKKGLRFSTYSVYWVRHYITLFMTHKGRPMGLCGSSMACTSVSLDAPLTEGDDQSLLDVFSPTNSSSDDLVERADLLRKLRATLTSLRFKPRENLLLRERLLAEDPMTLKEIGEAFAEVAGGKSQRTSRERARQMDQALREKITTRFQERHPDLFVP